MKDSKAINYRNRNLVFVDLETTGLDFCKHEIVEIGALLVDPNDFKIKDKFYSKVQPNHIETASKQALDMNIYNEREWKHALDIKTVLNKFAKFAGTGMFAGWKVDFDYSMLEIAYRVNKIKYSFDYHTFDVISLAFIYFRNKEKPEGLSLRSVAPELGVKIPSQHGAMDDIVATYEVFLKLIAEFE